MHPAISVIFFTVISGAGYGLLFLLALILLFDPQLIGRGEVLFLLLFGAGATALGLSSSLLHLGQPQRAWRALSQWRSSWLSREGVSALASFAPIAALIAGIATEVNADWIRAGAVALVLVCASTVYCTAQIYASLKTIPAWHNRHVTTIYFLCGLLSGAAWLLAIHSLAAAATDILRVALAVLIVLLACGLLLAKRTYWKFIDSKPATATLGSATGLDRFGTVRVGEAPHTEENYLTREMGFVVARKHARRLRAIAADLIGPAPALLSFVFILLWIKAMSGGPICALLAATSITAGCFVERWLFFAEAKHVVTLYYGAQRV